jgi:putative heme-binding domain-containing protein
MRREFEGSKDYTVNRMLGFFVILGIGCVLPAPLAAQDLSQQLLAEGATSLAAAAREKGDSVRGAILYSQKKLNCTGCHARGATDLLGPDLTQVPDDATDQHFVEAILQPSKTIKKGFESVAVLTDSGRVITGRIVTENDEAITLRQAPDNRLLRFAKANIETVNRTPKSSMPDGLADQLDDRQQFLDLIKYLMDIAGTATANDARYSAGGGKVEKRLLGLALLDQFQCRRCHQEAPGQETQGLIAAKRAPDLTSAAERIDPLYLQRFIADPLHTKPGTSMPDVMGGFDEASRLSAAKAITHFLISLSNDSFQRTAIDAESATRGRELFHTVGCVACHSPRNDRREEVLAESSIALGRVDTKYNRQGLVAFLKDPHSVRPQGRMPNMTLTHWEATDLANYLLQPPVDPPPVDPPPVDPPAEHDRGSDLPGDRSLAETGKRQFQELGCRNCHQLPGVDHPSNHRTLTSLRVDQGCLSEQAGSWPRFAMEPTQREAIADALQQLSEPLTAPQQVTLAMETFRCFACHRRGDVGGVSDLRDDYFHTENENLGPQGRIPPSLTGVGGKLKPKWLRQVLVSGRAIRPYLKTRMPQYGTASVAPLVDLFQQVDQVPDAKFAQLDDEKEARQVGTELVGRRGLNCIACHTFQQKPAQTMPAVDLTEMAERLHKSWFNRYMLSPQTLNPGTVMPSFWPGGKAIRKDILDGDPASQLEAIWLWMEDGRQARTPPGLQLEPIELVANDEAVMLRRSYQGIGKRGIGVGYPGGLNLAFDAEQMRLAMIWKGRFADPGAVWRGQGSGTVRPLGSDLIRFAQGPELGETPWQKVEETDRPKTHQFRGYDLDPLQRPTFRYRFAGIDVQDQSIVADKQTADKQTADRLTMVRTLSFETDKPHDKLFFRVASGGQITATDDGRFSVENRLGIAIDQNHAGEIIDREGGRHLVIPLEIPAGKSELVIRYTW